MWGAQEQPPTATPPKHSGPLKLGGAAGLKSQVPQYPNIRTSKGSSLDADRRIFWLPQQFRKLESPTGPSRQLMTCRDRLPPLPPFELLAPPAHTFAQVPKANQAIIATPATELVPLEVRYGGGTDVAVGAPATALRTVDGDQVVCGNAVVSVEYQVEYADEGAITRATILLRTANITAAAGRVVTVAQGFAIRWRREGAPEVAAQRALSGQPGYIAGRPVLAAFVAAAGGPVVPTAFGFRAGPVCPHAPARPLRFLFDVVSSGCAVRLSAAELRGLCNCTATAAPPGPVPAHLRPYVPNATHFGAFGDAEPSRPADWVPVAMKAPPVCKLHELGQGDWQCSDMAVGLDWHVVVTRVGSTANPQDRVSGVRRAFLRGDVQWRAALADADGRVPVWWQWRATFVRHSGDGAVAQGIVSPPPLLPVLPDDVFYPFVLAATAPADDRGEL